MSWPTTRWPRWCRTSPPSWNASRRSPGGTVDAALDAPRPSPSPPPASTAPCRDVARIVAGRPSSPVAAARTATGPLAVAAVERQLLRGGTLFPDGIPAGWGGSVLRGARAPRRRGVDAVVRRPLARRPSRRCCGRSTAIRSSCAAPRAAPWTGSTKVGRPARRCGGRRPPSLGARDGDDRRRRRRSVQDETPLRLTEWTSCGGCAAKWGGRAARRARPGPAPPAPTPACWWAGAVRRRRRLPPRRATPPWCRPPTSSRRSSTIPPTSAPSPPPTPAATCSPWAAGWCSRSTSPPSPSACRRGGGRHPRRGGGGRRRGGRRVAGGHTIRSEEPIFGLAVQGLVHPDRVGPRRAPGPATRSCCPSRSARHRAGRRRRRGQGGRHRGMRVLNRAAAEALRRRSAPTSTPSPT